MLVTEIIDHAAALSKLRREDILSDARNDIVCRTRFALYLALKRRLLGRGATRYLTAIGQWLGRDHSTVLYGVRRAEALAAKDAAFAALVDNIATVTPETACKPALQVLPDKVSATKEDTPMSYAENIEQRINTGLEARKSDLRVYWDGAIISSDEPARYSVYYRDRETDTVVYDGRCLEIAEVGEVPGSGLRVRYYEELPKALDEALDRREIKVLEDEEA